MREKGITAQSPATNDRWSHKSEGNNRLMAMGLLVAVVTIVLLLCLPALQSQLRTDDWVQLVVTKGYVDGFGSAPWDLYAYKPRNSPFYEHYYNLGVIPWWSGKDTYMHFFRPLGSLNLSMDYLFLDDYPKLRQLQNLLWYAAGMIVFFFCLRQYFKSGVLIALVILIYGIDDSKGQVVSWLANRNTLIATFFGLLSLVCLRKWSLSARYAYLWLSLGSIMLALLCTEGATAFFAYAFAYLVVMHQGDKIRAIAPFALILCFYSLLYVNFDYGVGGVYYYISPLDLPELGKALFNRAPFLLAATMTGIPADYWLVFQHLEPWIALAVNLGSLVVSVSFCLLIWKYTKEVPSIRFWLLGGMLSVLVTMLGPPAERHTLFPSFGISVVMGYLLWSGIRQFSLSRLKTLPGFALTVLAVYIVAVHIGHSGNRLRTQSAGPGEYSTLNAINLALADVKKLEEKQVVSLNPFADILVTYNYFQRLGLNQTIPASYLTLTAGFNGDVTVERETANRLNVYSDEALLSHGDLAFRYPTQRFTDSERVVKPGFSATVSKVNAAGEPLEVSYQFEKSLSEDVYVFLAWDNGRVSRVEMPPVGETMLLPGFQFY